MAFLISFTIQINFLFYFFVVFGSGMGMFFKYLVEQKEKKQLKYSSLTKYLKKKIEKRIDEYQFTMEMERDYFIQKCLTEEPFRKALFKKRTKTFLKSIDDSVINKSNMIGLLNGFTRSGKSIMAQSILFLIRKAFLKLLNIHYPIVVGFTREEMQEFLQNEEPPFGMSQDELPNESGKDSQLKLEAIKNVSESIRYLQISILICTPIKEGKGFVNFRLLMCGTNEQTNKLRAFLFEGDAKFPSGIIEIPYHRDKEFYDQYIEKKVAFLDTMTETGGFIHSAFNKDKAERDIDYYFNKFYSKYGTNLKSKSDIIALMELDGYNETENFKQRVASGIRARIIEIIYSEKSEVTPADKSIVKYDEFGVSEKPVREWEDEAFKFLVFEKMKDLLPLAIEQEYQKKKITKNEYLEFKDEIPQMIEVYDGLINKESYRDVATRIFNQPKNTKKIKVIKDIIQQKVLGYAGELAYCEYLDRAEEEYEHFGKNSKYPDFVIHSRSEIHSLKCYTLPLDSKAKQGLGGEELNLAIKSGYKLFILMYVMRSGIFTMYNVSVPETSHINNQLSWDTPPEKVRIRNTPSSFS